MTGMEIYVSGKTFFYPTDQSRRTSALAKKVAQSILSYLGKNVAPNAATVEFTKNNMQFSELTYGTLPNGSRWLCIKTDYSSHNAPADDPGTIILPVLAPESL